MNSYKYLPDVGTVIVSELPSPPETLPETNTAVGMVIVCAVEVTFMSSIILPNLLAAGKLENANVMDALLVSV